MEMVEEKSSAQSLLSAAPLRKTTFISILTIDRLGTRGASSIAPFCPLLLPRQAAAAGRELVAQNLQLALKTGLFFSHFLRYTKQSFVPLFVNLSHFSATWF